jgi:hypothetical protein
MRHKMCHERRLAYTGFAMDKCQATLAGGAMLAILNLENGLTKRVKEVISCLYDKKIPFTKVFQGKSNGLG